MTSRHRFGCIVVSLGLVLDLTAIRSVADVVVVVSSKSAVATLSRSQIADIFLGVTSRYPDGELAVPIDQAEGSHARDEFYEKLTGKSPAQVKTYWSKIIFTGRGRPPKTAGDGTEMKKFIAANPSAIGYLDDKLVDASVRVVN